MRLTHLVWLVPLGGCFVSDVDVAAALDADGDGYVDAALGGDDCDDAEPAIHPGADDHCDEEDNDCDGDIDNGPDRTAFFVDGDGDGYGVEASSILTCDADPPSGYAAGYGDCDDAAEAIHPGAVEICNHLDDDCDDSEDEGLSFSTWYLDADDDGYGVAGVTVSDCVEPDGYALLPGDCLDSDDQVRPDAPEVCNNGVDDDCDEDSNDCRLDGVVSVDTAHAAWYGSPDALLTGMGLAGGHLDSDGSVDLVIGGPWVGDGVVYILRGPVTAGATTLPGGASVITADASATYPGFGMQVAILGDVSGDGAPDLGVGWPDSWSGTESRVFVFDDLLGATDASDAVASVERADASAATVGSSELGGDDKTDLVVSFGSSMPDLWVFAGPVSGPLTSDEAATVFDAEDLGGGFATSWCADDLSGDGADDLLVGAPGYESAGATIGAAFVFTGPLGSVEDEWTVTTSYLGADGNTIGHEVSCIGDLDQDGYADLSVAASWASSGIGATYLFFGPYATSTVADADTTISGTMQQPQVVNPGDLDQDGSNDLIVGAWEAYDAAGSVSVWYGAPTGSVNLGDADARFDGPAEGDLAGYAVVGPGDFDDDGYPDFAFSIPAADPVDSMSGAIYLVLGAGP